jgi:LDH2 family malate/lactate/ureidoglycolate dehydrogenase
MIEPRSLPEGSVRFPAAHIHEFICSVIHKAGLLQSHAEKIADVLISADLRGIRSHGVARLPKFLSLIENGAIKKNPQMAFHAGSHTTGRFDADNGSGIVASDQAMDKALSMADEHGTGFVAVSNTSHFGYPGYYVHKAMEKGFIGICMSNGERIVTPTFATEPFMGSNPLSVGIPGNCNAHDFYLDMATAAVARGKIETFLKEGKPLHAGWVPESYGPPCLDDKGILMFDVPLLPLGGESPETGSHKGYALSLMVELLCSILSGQVNPSTGHFLGAIKMAAFRDPPHIHRHMQQIFNEIRQLKKAPGRERIYIPGEMEAIAESENRLLGIPLTPAVMKQIHRLNRDMDLGYKF